MTEGLTLLVALAALGFAIWAASYYRRQAISSERAVELMEQERAERERSKRATIEAYSEIRESHERKIERIHGRDRMLAEMLSRPMPDIGAVLKGLSKDS
jgi:hypothetical protein